MKNSICKNTLLVGNIVNDSSNYLNSKTYKFKAILTDTYHINTKYDIIKSISLYDKNKQVIANNFKDTNVDLKENEIYYLTLELDNTKNVEYSFDFYPVNKKIINPYKLIKKEVSNVSDEAIIDFIPRKGGTYIYSNVPESMPIDALNSILMQNKNLIGECFLTFEHQNRTGVDGIYIGYRIVNKEKHDIYLTVTNIGYQTKGSWQGEKSWMDYYGVTFNANHEKFYDKPFKYQDKEFTADQWFHDYLNFDTKYVPNPIQVTTYRIPAGSYIYVIGGTSIDAYLNANVHNTADIKISLNECVNGNVKFIISNGKALGELCVYDDINIINESPKVQNLRRYGENDDFGGRIGYFPIHGVIDNYASWRFDDNTKEGNLPVTYTNYYATTLKEKYEPFEKVKGCTYHVVHNDCWLTHLSCQLHHEYCGKDMVDTYAICNGKKVVLSNYIANPTGQIWDFGNWMIEYQEYLTFKNEGNKDRDLSFYLDNGSTVFYMIKDLEDNIIKSGATVNVCTGDISIYECSVKANSSIAVVLQYVLPANTGGSIKHYVRLK